MPAYNEGEYIGEAIQSLIDQSYNKWELIIVDDGSNDNTENIVNSFNDKRIKYFKQDNEGASSAKNLGLSKNQGDYFIITH